MHFLVTGGSSDLARLTVDALLREGHRISWAGPPLRNRSAGKLYLMRRPEAPWRSVDFRGLDGLIHLAGPHPSAHLSEFDLRRTREFERSLISRAADARVERIVSVGVVSNPRVRDHPFVRLKRTTERLLTESHLPATVFRVPWMYGPNDDFLTRLWRWVRHRSVLLVPGIATAPVQLCSEKRLAEAVVQAVARTPAQMRIYEAATSDPLPLGELIEQLGRIVRGTPPQMVPVSGKVAFHLRGPLKVVGLIPLRSPMWSLLAGGLTCATTAFERDFDVVVRPPLRALIEFVREKGRGVPWWGRSVPLAGLGPRP